MKSGHIKAVVFDLGGVFLQTKVKNPRIRLANKFGLNYDELSEIVFESETAQLATLGAIEEQDHWIFIAKHFHLNDSEVLKFWDEFWSGDVLNIELLKFAKSLKEVYRLGILSNAWSGTRDFLTQKHDILDLFDVSIFSAEVKMKKPDPTIYLYLLDALKVDASEMIFVDDFIENIQAAEVLGIKTVHFKSTTQTISEIQTLIGS